MPQDDLTPEEARALKVPAHNVAPFVRWSLEVARRNPDAAKVTEELRMMQAVACELETNPDSPIVTALIKLMGLDDLGDDDTAAMYGRFCASRGGVGEPS